MIAHTPTRPATAPAKHDPTSFRKWLVIVVAVVGLAVAAVVEGKLSNRWGVSSDVLAAAAKLDGVPATFGAWTSEEVPMSEKVLKVAEATGHVSRSYTNRKNGSQVSVLLLCGPSGPIGAHTPEVCYAGNGFAMIGEAQKKTVTPLNQTAATYWSARFEKKSPPSALRVCWMWGTDGDWEASTNARFGLRIALYKLYVVRNEPETGATRGNDRDPINEFLMDFLPEVKKALADAK